MNLLFQIVTLFLQFGLVFADRQQLTLSFFKAARQLINNLQHDTFPWITEGNKNPSKHTRNPQSVVVKIVEVAEEKTQCENNYFTESVYLSSLAFKCSISCQSVRTVLVTAFL